MSAPRITVNVIAPKAEYVTVDSHVPFEPVQPCADQDEFLSVLRESVAEIRKRLGELNEQRGMSGAESVHAETLTPDDLGRHVAKIIKAWEARR